MAKLTQEEVLSWNDKKLESTVKGNTAKFTTDGPISPEGKEAKNNPVTRSLQQLKGAWELRNQKRVKTQAWFIPAVIIVATGGTYALFSLRPAEVVFVGLIIVTLVYLWLSGKVSQYEKRTFSHLVQESERQASIMFEKSIETWARKRYELPEGNITWGAYGSEFRLKGKAFTWNELTPGEWVIVDAETRQEAPQRLSQ